MEVKHKQALEKAIEWIKSYFNPIGIIVSGSIIRGNPNDKSDFDIYIIHEEGFRQRIQKYFDGVACELFINTPNQVCAYFEQDYHSNRPVTAHMIASGVFYFGENHSECKKIVETAKSYLSKKPIVSDKRLIFDKYSIALSFEDAIDMKNIDSVTASYFLHKSMYDLINFLYYKNQIQLPRAKERISTIKLLFPEIYIHVINFYTSNQIDQKIEIMQFLMNTYLGEIGFFEWESEKEYLKME